MTEAKRERWIAEGRGTGEGADYLSWLRYEDVPSRGAKHRLVEGKTGRSCALFSSVEHALFLYLDFAGLVQQLFEGYPLLLDETRAIAADLGIQHPRDPQSGVDITMTTDLRAQAQTEAGLVWLPFSCKHSSDLDDFNIAEHMQIERVYWQQRGETLRVVTEDAFCISEVTMLNLKAMYPHRRLHRELLPPALTLEERNTIVLRALLSDPPSAPLIDFAADLAKNYGLTTSDWMAQIWHMAYRGLLRADISLGDLRERDVRELATTTRALTEQGGAQ